MRICIIFGGSFRNFSVFKDFWIFFGFSKTEDCQRFVEMLESVKIFVGFLRNFRRFLSDLTTFLLTALFYRDGQSQMLSISALRHTNWFFKIIKHFDEENGNT